MPGDLAKHRCLDFSFKRVVSEWPFVVDGATIHLPVRGGMLTNNGETMLTLTLQGLGIGRLGRFQIEDDLRTGRLMKLLPAFNLGDREEINVIFAKARHMPLRTRVFIDYLVERLSPGLRG